MLDNPPASKGPQFKFCAAEAFLEDPDQYLSVEVYFRTFAHTRPQIWRRECTCGSLGAKWKCKNGAHLGLSCTLRCLCACWLCVLHAR